MTRKKQIHKAAEISRQSSAETLTTFGLQTHIDDVVSLTGMTLSYDEIAESAFAKGAEWADANPAWRMCEDVMPTDPHQPYWVYARCCGECCVAYLQEKTNIFYDEGGEELSGVVAWLPLPRFKI